MPRLMTSDDVSLDAEDVGAGEPIILLHEFGGGYASLRYQIDHLAADRRVIAFNARGFDPSSAPERLDQYTLDRAVADVTDVMDGSGIRSCHVVGVSLGSATAFRLALSHPERVRSLALVSWGYGMDPTDNPEFRRQSLASAELIERDGMGAFVDAYAQYPVRRPCIDSNPRAFEEMMAVMRTRSAIGTAMTLRGLQAVRPPYDDALRSELGRLTMPTLIVSGDRDPPSLGPSLKLHEDVPGSTLHVLPGGGHTLYLERPEELVALLEGHLDAAERSRPG